MRSVLVVVFAATLVVQTFGPIAHAGALPRAVAPAAKTVVRPDINAGNPSCPNPPANTFAGGTGAFYSNQFESNYVTAPYSGAADVPNGHFKNIFLFNGGGSWDAHMASLPAAMRGPTQEQIDTLTSALVCSSYFDNLTQYNINPPTFDGDVATDPSCVTNAINDAVSTGNVISYATMRSFAACIVNNAGDSTPQVNIFVAPDTKASAYGEDTIGMCTGGTNTAAYHGWGLSVPNFTVEPTNSDGSHPCNQPGPLLDSLSHEMVETLSDPGGFGWSHASGLAHADLGKQLDEGQLGDICSGVGAFPTPANNPGALPFPDTGGMTGLSYAPYWSDQDNACEPKSIMNDTLVSNVSTGNPLVSMSSTTHNFDIPVHQVSPPTGVVDEWELDVETGPDNLNSSSAVNAILTFNVGGVSTTLQQNSLNQGAEWATDSLHEVNLAIPAGLSINDVTDIKLNTQFGGPFPDTWDVQGVILQADVQPPDSCTAPPQLFVNPANETTSTQDDGHPAIARMKGGASQTFALPTTAISGGNANRLVTGILLTVSTGQDDLRGGNHETDNANAMLTTSRASVPFPNINRDQELPNGSTQPKNVDLLQWNTLPAQTTAHELTGFALQTNLPGGAGGDNWDVGSVTVIVELGCIAGSPPATQATTLLSVVGSSVLFDGHTGLCELRGDSHDCFQTVTVPAGLSASDPIDSLTVTITTGDDNLEGGGFPESNANVLLAGFTQPFPDVNMMQEWRNGETHTVFLAPMPSSPVTLGALNKIDINANFSGGSGGDNWDVKALTVDAVVTPVGAASAHGASAGVNTTGTAAHASSTEPSTASAAPAAPAVTPLVMGPSPWQVVPTSNSAAGDNVLNGVTCADPTHCFAVGYSGDKYGARQAAIESSSGGNTPFNAMTPAALSESYSQLNSVSCISTTNCYAVGFDGSGSPEGDADAGTKKVLIENWNGSTWTLTQSANPAGDVSSELTGVSCVAPTPQTAMCMASGYATSTGVAQTLTMRWLPATGWLVVGSPNADTGNNLLNGVSCTSSSQCAAVGYSDGSGFAQTLTESYNGTSWTIVTSGNAGTQGNVFDGMGNNYLSSVSCSSATNCVAVGGTVNANRISQTLTETLQNGGVGGQPQWEPVPAPNPSQSGNLLFGVSCTTPTDCKAVGVQWNGDVDNTLNENFDGTSWFVTPTPSPGPERNFLLGDECVNPVSCLAVGDFVNPANVKQTLALNLVATAPDAPTNPTATSGNGQAQVSFTAPVNNGGFNVTGYVITPFIGFVAQPSVTFNSPATTETVTGLTNGQKYGFKVAAKNFVGTGAQSTLSTPIAIGLPTAPSAVIATPGNAAATVTWTVPTSDNGSPITGYVVTPFIGFNAQLPVTFNTPATTEIVSSLTNATKYAFKVAAINASGTGPQSTLSASIIVGSPTAPTNAHATAGTGKATVTWNAPASGNGAPITGYVITPILNGVAEPPKTYSSTALSEVVTGLQKGQSYTFEVAGVNTRGTGVNSTQSNSIKPK